jgi:competence protein ComZ
LIHNGNLSFSFFFDKFRIEVLILNREATNEIKGDQTMNTQDKSMQFMQIAMKYLPQAKDQLDQAGVELSFELIQPFMELFTQVMKEAYELGREDALNEVKQDS